MELDWNRQCIGWAENRMVLPALAAVRSFFSSFTDLAVKDRYADHKGAIRLRAIITPLILNAHDAKVSLDVVQVDELEIPGEFIKLHQTEWGELQSILAALQDRKLIKFTSWAEGKIVYCLFEPTHSNNSRIEARSEFFNSTTATQSASADDIRGQKGIDGPAMEGVLADADTPRNPLNYSRQLDVHTWSDHTEVNQFVDEIYSNHFSGGNVKIRKKHLKVVLLDLYLAWSEDPELKIAFYRDANAYLPKSRYNGLFISNMTITVVDRLIEAHFVEQAIGNYDKETGSGWVSRMWPTPELIDKFKAAKFGTFDIDNHTNQECIILRDVVIKQRKKRGSQKMEDYKETVDIEYEDTDKTKQMRQQVTAYNELLQRTFVDIPSLETPTIELGKNKKGQEVRIFVNQRDKFTRRIFNRGSFGKGGRFWGGWWQRCPKEWRAGIFMNDEATSEVDYSGMHIVILYAQLGIDYWQTLEADPYTIAFPELDIESEKLREICKQLILLALNAKTESAAFNAFRDEAEKGSLEKSLTNKQLKPILNKLREMHGPIADKFASDAGIDLMRTDSEITAKIIQHFTDNEIPILILHDSFIVPTDFTGELKKQMLIAFEQVTGIPNPKLKEQTHNPYDFEPLSLDDRIDHKAWADAVRYRFDPPRSKRYQFQFDEFRKWSGFSPEQSE